MKEKDYKKIDKEIGEQVIRIDDTPVPELPAEQAKLSAWKPLPMPIGLEKHCRPCPQCLPVRAALRQLDNHFSTNRSPAVALVHDGVKIHLPALLVRCGWCNDTGIEVDQDLLKIVREVARLRAKPKAD